MTQLIELPASLAPRNAQAAAGDAAAGASVGRGAPRLALVLGSGGVRAIASLGMLQVLHEAGIRPDLIVGCSAGAVFGALAAAGNDAQGCLHLAQTLWSREITSQRRPRAWLEAALGSMLPSEADGFDSRFAMRDDRMIMDRLRQAFGAAELQQLPTPMVVAATDASTGRAVQLNQGPVCDALRASVAVPFLFAPHRLQGRLLVDGSLCDPLPLGAASHAQVVMAMGFEVPVPRRVDGPMRLAGRVTASLTNNLMHAHIAAHEGPTRIVLLPTLERRVGLFETQAMPELVALGRRVTLQALPRLERALAGQPLPPAAARASGPERHGSMSAPRPSAPGSGARGASLDRCVVAGPA